MQSNLVYAFVFTTVVACHLAVGFENSMRRITLCQDEEPVALNCTDNCTISIKKTEIGNQPCRHQVSNCNSELYSHVSELCSGTVTCNVTSDIFPKECKRFQRHIKTDIKCSFWGSSKKKSFSICTNSLPEVQCSWPRHIHMKKVYIKPEDSECDNDFDGNSAFTRMTELCEEKKACLEETDVNSCLFGKMFLHIFYTCSDEVSCPVTSPAVISPPSKAVTHNEESSKTRLIVGVIFSVLFVCALAIVIFCFLRRSNYFVKEKGKEDNMMLNVPTGTMDVSTESQQYVELSRTNQNDHIYKVLSDSLNPRNSTIDGADYTSIDDTQNVRQQSTNVDTTPEYIIIADVQSDNVDGKSAKHLVDPPSNYDVSFHDGLQSMSQSHDRMFNN